MMFNLSRSVLAGTTTAMRQQWLDAQTAYAQLMTGGKPVTVSYEGKIGHLHRHPGSAGLLAWIGLLQAVCCGLSQIPPSRASSVFQVMPLMSDNGRSARGRRPAALGRARQRSTPNPRGPSAERRPRATTAARPTTPLTFLRPAHGRVDAGAVEPRRRAQPVSRPHRFARAGHGAQRRLGVGRGHPHPRQRHRPEPCGRSPSPTTSSWPTTPATAPFDIRVGQGIRAGGRRELADPGRNDEQLYGATRRATRPSAR